jgi:hypothetical protein
MTAKQFDDLGLKANDNVQITMNDGQIFNVILYSGNAYLGRGELQNYITKEIIPADPVKILINGNNVNGFAEFIFLDEVAEVIPLV